MTALQREAGAHLRAIASALKGLDDLGLRIKVKNGIVFTEVGLVFDTDNEGWVVRMLVGEPPPWVGQGQDGEEP